NDRARALQRLRRAHAHAAHRVRHPLLLRGPVARLRKGPGNAGGVGAHMTATSATSATSATTFRVIGPRVRRRRSPLGRWYRRNERSALGVAGLVSFFAFWQAGSMAGWIDPFFFSSPSDVFAAAVAEAPLP